LLHPDGIRLRNPLAAATPGCIAVTLIPALGESICRDQTDPKIKLFAEK